MDEKRLINAAINDVWKLIKRYYETRQDDAFWKEVVDAGVAISDKYNHHPLVDDFVKDAVMWLDLTPVVRVVVLFIAVSPNTLYTVQNGGRN